MLAKSLTSGQGFSSRLKNIFHYMNYKYMVKTAKNYLDICQLAANNTYIFNNFKQLKLYTNVLEHVSPKQGRQYIDEIIKDKIINLGKDREIISSNDIYGNPNIINYGEYGSYSPATLRPLRYFEWVRRANGWH